MNDRIAQLEAQVAELTKVVQSLRSSTSIPFEIDKAFSARLTGNLQEKVQDLTADFPSPPFAQSVNEAGTSSYQVMTTPEYALQLKLGSIYVAIPAFDI